MFGLVVPNIDLLSKEDQTRYQQIYCGLCYKLKENYNNFSRLCLTFDLTFLILLLSSLYEPKETDKKCGCIFKSGKRRDIILNNFSEYSADLTIALAYHKFIDDIEDDNSTKSKIGKHALNKQYKKVENKLPEHCNAIQECMNKISELEKFSEEKSKSSNISDDIKFELSQSGDEISKTFGLLLSNLFSPYKDLWTPYLAKIGFNLGRFIYYADAVIDLEEDLKNNNYNPFKYLDSFSIYIENSSIINKESFIKDVNAKLSIFIGLACEAYEMLPIIKDKSILDEILYEGVWSVYNSKTAKN